MPTKKQERALEINSRLKRMYPKAKCTLDFTNAFEHAQDLGKNVVVACVWSGGKWYVEGGVGLSPVPPT